MLLFFGPVLFKLSNYFIEGAVEAFETASQAHINKRSAEIGMPDALQELRKLPVGALYIMYQSGHFNYSQHSDNQGNDSPVSLIKQMYKKQQGEGNKYCPDKNQ
jgi:hypothetical protein